MPKLVDLEALRKFKEREDAVIANSVLEETNRALTEEAKKYEKPEGGIPESDLTSSIRNLLALASTAVQSLDGYATEDYVDNAVAGRATEGYVNQKIADLVDTAPETLDTLGELATALQEHEGAYEALLSAVGNKVEKVEGKQLSSNDYTTAEKQKLANLAAVATSGSYDDLEDKPNIPEGATLYGSTGQNTDGAMTQKAVTDALRYFYTCTTEAETTTKEIVAPELLEPSGTSWKPPVGERIVIKFTHGSKTTNPQLKIWTSEEKTQYSQKPIRFKGTNLVTRVFSNEALELVFDDSNWQAVNRTANINKMEGSANIYAPTSAGEAGQILKSVGNYGAPVWGENNPFEGWQDWSNGFGSIGAGVQNGQVVYAVIVKEQADDDDEDLILYRYAACVTVPMVESENGYCSSSPIFSFDGDRNLYCLLCDGDLFIQKRNTDGTWSSTNQFAIYYKIT